MKQRYIFIPIIILVLIGLLLIFALIAASFGGGSDQELNILGYSLVGVGLLIVGLIIFAVYNAFHNKSSEPIDPSKPNLKPLRLLQFLLFLNLAFAILQAMTNRFGFFSDASAVVFVLVPTIAFIISFWPEKRQAYTIISLLFILSLTYAVFIESREIFEEPLQFFFYAPSLLMSLILYFKAKKQPFIDEAVAMPHQ